MNLSTTAGAALNRFGLGVAGFAASQNKKQQQQDLEPSTANVVQQGIINTLEKALAKSKLEVKTLKNNNCTNNDEIVSDEEDDEDENEFDEEDTDENMANNNMQLGINNKIKKEVSLASQTQYVPHVGFPQSEPVIKVIKVNIIATNGISLAIKTNNGNFQIR